METRQRPVDLADFLATYKGGISVDEGMALRQYAANSFDHVVEIGSYRGKSAVAMAHGLLESRPDATIFCVEPHEPFVGVYGGRFGPQDRGDFFQVMLETGFFRNVALINMRSAEAAAGWTRPVGLLMIDGDHTLEGVKIDIGAWERHVSVDGVIVFDDALDISIGPFHVIEELIASGRYSKIDTTGKMVFVRKLSAAADIKQA